MNGFEKHGLDEDAFGEKPGIAAQLRTFDAFPKTKPTYTSASRRGGQWTIFILALCATLTFSELAKWYRGTENHHFSVEKGVSTELQLNLDMVVRMPCNTLRVNVQDAAGDHISAGELLTKEPTSWDAWNRHFNKGGAAKEYQTLSAEDAERLAEQEEDMHVDHVFDEVRRSPKKFPKGPKLKKREAVDSCRVYGSLEGNKVQGNFHITAKGLGYFEPVDTLDPNYINFSHFITELSFGPRYSKLLNPLDKTTATTNENFFKYQYYLSIVPTIYTKAGIVDPYNQVLPDPSSISYRQSKNTVFTNQYAATSHSGVIPRSMFSVPGIFFKYDIEPILLVVSDEHGSLLALLIRLVNVVSGVMVAGGWTFQIGSWAVEVWGRKRRAREGMLTGKHDGEDE